MQLTRTLSGVGSRAVAVFCVVAGLLSGCGLSTSLPSASKNSIELVGGGQVEIVSRARDTNPTDQWVDTYLMLEVTGPEPYLDTVVSTLTENGWKIEAASTAAESLPSAVLPDAAYLTLVEFDGYIESIRSNPVAVEAFARVPTSDDKGYYVAIVMPIWQR